MPRKANDGRGRLGGRQAGTPNKDNSLKVLLQEHSIDYFTPTLKAKDIFKEDEELRKKYANKVFSQYEYDLLCMKPSDRAKLEVDLLAFHTPKMQAISADMAVKANKTPFTERLARLSKGEEISSDED